MLLQHFKQGSGTFQGTIIFDKSMPSMGKKAQVPGSWRYLLVVVFVYFADVRASLASSVIRVSFWFVATWM